MIEDIEYLYAYFKTKSIIKRFNSGPGKCTVFSNNAIIEFIHQRSLLLAIRGKDLTPRKLDDFDTAEIILFSFTISQLNGWIDDVNTTDVSE